MTVIICQHSAVIYEVLRLQKQIYKNKWCIKSRIYIKP